MSDAAARLTLIKSSAAERGIAVRQINGDAYVLVGGDDGPLAWWSGLELVTMPEDVFVESLDRALAKQRLPL